MYETTLLPFRDAIVGVAAAIAVVFVVVIIIIDVSQLFQVCRRIFVRL